MSKELVTLVIRAVNSADVLARVVMLFHRLNIEIWGLRMGRTKTSKLLWVNVSVAADAEHSVRLEAHLYKLVQVKSVKTLADAQITHRDKVVEPGSVASDEDDALGRPSRQKKSKMGR